MCVEHLGAVRSGRVAARGDPMPLGLVAFTVSAFAIGVSLAGWWADPGARLALTKSMATALGGVGQLVAGMSSLVRGLTLSATFFRALGAFWRGHGIYLLTAVPTISATVAVQGIETTALRPLGVAIGGSSCSS